MSLASRRNAPARSQAPASAASPLWNAVLVLAAIVAATWTLVARGRLSWPPSELLTAAYTVAGCLALIGPVVVARRENVESGLGEWMWMSAGVLTWLYDFAALLRGDVRQHAWATPISAGGIGLLVTSVLVSGWRLQPAAASNRSSWRWTNVVGWILGLFWIGMGLATLVPTFPQT